MENGTHTNNTEENGSCSTSAKRPSRGGSKLRRSLRYSSSEKPEVRLQQTPLKEGESKKQKLQGLWYINKSGGSEKGKKGINHIYGSIGMGGEGTT